MMERWRARLRAVRQLRGSKSSEMNRLVERQREALGLGLGIIRNAAGLEEVLVEIDSLRKHLRATPQSNLSDLIAAIELEDTLDVGAACAASALLREESRASPLPRRLSRNRSGLAPNHNLPKRESRDPAFEGRAG